MNRVTENLRPDQIVVMEEKSQVLSAISQFASVSQVLRFLGAAVMVASMSVFLLQGWDSTNDTVRCFILLAQTVLLAAGGFGLSFLLKENKGARVFFGLSLASIPANFTVLGALIYSQFQWDGGLGTYPEFATWVMTDLSYMTFTILAVLAVLIPVAFLGYSVMARRSSKKLAITLLLASSALLLPVRGSLYVGILVVAIALFVLINVTRMAKDDLTLRTPEGIFARFLPFVPAVIVLARSIFFYQPDAFLVVTIALTAFVIMRHISLQLEAEHWLRSVLELTSPLVALVVAMNLFDGIEHIVNETLLIPIFVSVFGAMVADVAYRCGRYQGLYINAAAVVLAVGFMIYVLIFSSVLIAGLCVIAGIGILTAGYMMRRRFVLVLGAITLLVGLANQLIEVIQFIDLTSWGSLAVIGATAIIIASVLDRHGPALKLRATHWLKLASNKEDAME